MNKTFSYIVTKNYFNPASSDNAFSNIMGVFHNKQDAIYFVNKLVIEWQECGIMPESLYVNDISDADYVYSVDFIYMNRDELDPNFGVGEDSKTTYRVDRYEIK